jgi:hypothetical protein
MTLVTLPWVKRSNPGADDMPDNEGFDDVRREMVQLLGAQLEALADLSGLSDAQLADCYRRHERVRELRDRLSLQADWRGDTTSDETPALTAGNSEAAVAGV